MTATLIEQLRFDSLIELASRRFANTLLQTEAQVLVHSVKPDALPVPPENHPQPLIRVEFLRWLITDPEVTPFIDQKGIRVWSVTVPTVLDLQGCRVVHELHFLHCSFQDIMYMFSGEFKALYIMRCNFVRGVLADGISVHGAFFFKDSKSNGKISLVGLQAEQNVDFSGSHLACSEDALVLDGAQIRRSLFLHQGFKSSGHIRLLNATVGGDLGFDGAEVTAIEKAVSLDKAIVEGKLSFSQGFNASGLVSMPGGRVAGDLDCSGGIFNAKGMAFNLATLTIGGHLYLKDGFKASGLICLHSAQIGNSIDCSGAKLSDSQTAILLEEADVRGSIYLCDGFESYGNIAVHGSHIHGNLTCDDARLPALYCSNMKLEGDLIWTGMRNLGTTSLWLNGAIVKNIRDDRESWPTFGNLHLNGLKYLDLTLNVLRTPTELNTNNMGMAQKIKAKDRIDWLNLQPLAERGEPQPWIQLAEILKSRGEIAGSKRVIFELRRIQAGHSRRPTRWFKIYYAKLVERPLLILVSVVAFTVAGSCIFEIAGKDGAMAPTQKDAYLDWSKGGSQVIAYPQFNPIIYSLENSLPLVKLGQDDKWTPDHNHQTSSWIANYAFLHAMRVLLILVGWLHATVLASAVGSRFKD